MERMSKKVYLNLSFSIVTTSFSFLIFIFEIIFFCITVGFPNWPVEGIIILNITLFVGLLSPMLVLVFFEAWRYFYFDEEGIVNGWLFYKKRLNYKDVERIFIKHLFVGSSRPMWQKNLCFKKGKKTIVVPISLLKNNEIEFFKEKTGQNITEIKGYFI